MAEESDKELKLRVAKAIPSDVGHGRARVPFDNELNLKPGDIIEICLLYTSPSPRDVEEARMPSSA